MNHPNPTKIPKSLLPMNPESFSKYLQDCFLNSHQSSQELRMRNAWNELQLAPISMGTFLPQGGVDLTNETFNSKSFLEFFVYFLNLFSSSNQIGSLVSGSNSINNG